MGGPASLTLRHIAPMRERAEDTCNEVRAELDRLEAKYSRYVEASVISEINRNAGSGTVTKIDDETRGLLHVCSRLYEQSDGLFDPTAGTLNAVWNLQSGRIDAPQRLPTLLNRIGWHKVKISADGVYLPEANTSLDLGGVVKEYAVDLGVKLLRRRGFNDVIVELAGDVFASGTNDHNMPWRIGVADPSQPDKPLTTIELEDAALTSSGSYQRFFTHKGVRYSHFLNPKTGYPVAGAISVSVVGENALMAGAVATIACLKGSESAKAWLLAADLPWLIINESGRLEGPLANR